MVRVFFVLNLEGVSSVLLEKSSLKLLSAESLSFSYAVSFSDAAGL